MRNDNLKPSENCVQVTKYNEQLYRDAYPDPGSVLGKALTKRGFRMTDYKKLNGWSDLNGKPWTLGYGHTKGVKQGDTCSDQQAFQWLREDLEIAADLVRKNVPIALNQGEFDCLTDMAFNMGGAFMQKDAEAGDFDDFLRDGNKAEIRRRIPSFRKGGGIVLPGLVKRRAADVALWDGDDYTTALRKGEETLTKWRANGGA